MNSNSVDLSILMCQSAIAGSQQNQSNVHINDNQNGSIQWDTWFVRGVKSRVWVIGDFQNWKAIVVAKPREIRFEARTQSAHHYLVFDIEKQELRDHTRPLDSRQIQPFMERVLKVMTASGVRYFEEKSR